MKVTHHLWIQHLWLSLACRIIRQLHIRVLRISGLRRTTHVHRPRYVQSILGTGVKLHGVLLLNAQVGELVNKVNTGSYSQIAKVKQLWARLVAGWVTALCDK